MFYCALILAGLLLVTMLFSIRSQMRLHSDPDLPGMVRLLLPVDPDAMREMFDPSVECRLRAGSSPQVFKFIQRNRRKLAIQFASHIFHNACVLQRVGYAGKQSGKREEIIRGQLLVDAGVPVRIRAALLLIFLRLEQFTCPGSNLSCLRDIVNDLLPDWEELAYGASSLTRTIHPRLHEELMRLLTPSLAGHIAQ